MNQPAMQGVPALNVPDYVKHPRLIAWVGEVAALGARDPRPRTPTPVADVLPPSFGTRGEMMGGSVAPPPTAAVTSHPAAIAAPARGRPVRTRCSPFASSARAASDTSTT